MAFGDNAFRLYGAEVQVQRITNPEQKCIANDFQIAGITATTLSAIIRRWVTDSFSPALLLAYPVTAFNGASALAGCSTTTTAQAPDKRRFCFWTVRRQAEPS